jgi:preprotein translocase YajC subunit
VVTTGGIVGTITRVSEEGIKLEIAPSVRIDVVRTAIVGFQGQPPVADQSA